MVDVITYQSQYIASALAQIWRLFYEVESPFFGLHYSEILLGYFIISFMIKLLKWIFVPDMQGGKDKGSKGQNDD